MKIIEPSFPTNEEEDSILRMAEKERGFAYRSKIEWVTVVVHEIDAAGRLLNTIVKPMSPGLIPGELMWAAMPDQGCSLIVDRGPWVEPRGELTFKVGSSKAIIRGGNPRMSAFHGSMACLAAGYKLISRDGSDYGVENAGNVFTWANVSGKEIALKIRRLQRKLEAEHDAAARLAVDAAWAGIRAKAEALLGEELTEKLVRENVLYEVLIEPQYARALKELLKRNFPVRDSRIAFRPITGVWVPGKRGSEAKNLVLKAYAAIRWL